VTTTIDQVGRSDTGSPARAPDEQGVVTRDGVRIHWERFGEGAPAILLFPSWSIVHSRMWKGQVPYLARHATVITFDPRGNGLSDRPTDRSAYDATEYADDAVAVLDAAGVEQACLVGLSLGGLYAALFAGRNPERTLGAAILAPTIPFLVTPGFGRDAVSFDAELDTDEGWAKFNRHFWLRDYRGFLEFFFGQIFPEPHSTKQIEDAVSWGLDTDAETMIATRGSASGFASSEEVETFLRSLRCPVVVIHGTDDRIVEFERGVRVAELTGRELVRMECSGHSPQARDPVKINLVLRDLLDRVSGRPPAGHAWRRSLERPKRALLISSPIGLGHAWRDIAIADELRRQVPGLEIDWLAQEPVTTVLRQRGETIHPASRELAAEAAHIDREAGEHDLHAFQAIRRMDEILCANFMLFHDVVREQRYDVWIGDEAWEVDHFLHENPELKTSPFAWLSDFVGFLPMPAGGEREAFLTADYNAEMIEHVERYPRLRDRAIYVGDPDDLVPGTFGPGLPEIREWTSRHYRFSGYIPAFDARTLGARHDLRAELGYGGEPVCIVSVGGSGVGAALLRRVIESLPQARERIPGLRMIAVAGPRIDPASLPQAVGLEVHGYVHELYRHLAACDLAIVQGGLTTTMELVAAGRPFISFPLASHFEQRFWVRHRLDRYGARTWLDYRDATPEVLADAIAGQIGSEPQYRPIQPGGAAKAAALIAELL
jgi:pimeloyl-ACP methyl ester carboxylesterase/predicted glycosyltransferase